MEDKKKDLIDKGLSLRSEEVNEVMGKVPHRLFGVGTAVIICTVVFLAVTGCLLQVPSYMEVPYVVSGNTPPIGIVSANAGTVTFRYDRPQEIKAGDTVATVVTKDNECFYCTSPISGIVESDFLYVTGDNIAKGDTLARVVSRGLHNYKLILKIPQDMRPKVGRGMKIKFTAEGTTAGNAVGHIGKVAVIPDNSNSYDALVEIPASIIQHLPRKGKAKLQYRTEHVIGKILSGKNNPRPAP